jgi:hypothetical protein
MAFRLREGLMVRNRGGDRNPRVRHTGARSIEALEWQ